ncbi:MAG: hypothetical protein IJE47_06965 [Bacteroidales bacterium]|nr:hypothetical protein [Bacteroidales bacterium]
MKISTLIIFLLLAFDCQQTIVNGQQTFLESENLKNSKTEKGLRANDKGQKSEGRKVTRSQSDCLSDSEEDTVVKDDIIERLKNLNDKADSLRDAGNITAAAKNCFEMIEMVEKNVKKKNLTEDHRKRLVNAYARLGDFFKDHTYPKIAALKYKKSLRWNEALNNDDIGSQLLKMIGMSYMYFNADSALYYFDECVKTYPNHLNKIDIDKAIADYLFYEKNERDSAMRMMRDNFNIIEHEHVRYSYYSIYGGMLYEEKQYDSAIYYLEQAMNSSYFFTRLCSASVLSQVYDSIGDYEKKAYYDDITAKHSIERVENESDVSELMDLYNIHKANMSEIKKNQTKKKVTIILTPIILIVAALIILRISRNKKRINSLSSIIDERDKEIQDIRFKQSLVEGKIKKKNAEIQKQAEIIKEQEQKISTINDRLEKSNSKKSDLNSYRNSEICIRIMSHIKENHDSETTALSQEELMSLVQMANLHLNDFIDDLSQNFPRLKNEDLYYICLTMLNLSDKQISSLFGVAYSTIKTRKTKIATILDMENEDLYKYFIDKIYTR